MSTPQPLADRYGTARSSGKTKRGAILFGALAVIVSAAIAYVAFRLIGSDPLSAERVAFTVRPDNTMEVTLDVERNEPERPAVCVVRVRDISGAETGRREVYVPPSEGSVRLRTVITSGSPPVTADVFGCTYSVPDYLSRP
ncbi:DUF4307 domain-containing protein [Haloechinothrix halophila]|uniref:DUF4307 domain-containing protein n=1 Tax=Haloechinothrix halophila TaxID=1069073 RepID=UPI00041C1E2D|nr:DUF4307 domain-containing protein [Haloechinothrix halophila]